jgi:hypothetical protein
VRVTNPEPRDPLFATIIKAAAQVGIRHNPDYNGNSQEGIAIGQRRISWPGGADLQAHGELCRR